MSDVFISYASEDRDRVRPLAEALQKRGFNIWWDRSLAAGQDYAQIIERELRGARAVIVVWTRGSAASTFVRDEAGRARDEGRLVPVMLDRVEIPLGFGAFQAEDFTRWNGGATAPQMQLLEEALRAKLEGRNVDGGVIAAKRRRLMNRIRVVSVLTVLALVVGIAAFGKYIITPQQHHATQADLQAQLLRLLEEGRLTPEQAAQLAQSMGLEGGALGSASTQLASASPSRGLPGAPMSETAPGSTDDQLQLASDQQFSADAQQTYQAAIANLLTHPDSSVRLAALHLSDPTQRDAALQTLTAYAQAHPEDPQANNMILVAGAVGVANGSPLGQQALETAANASPQNPVVWRMLSHAYVRANRGQEAQAAANVSQAVQAQASGQSDAAEQQLQSALPNLSSPILQAPVASELGRIAERRGDFSSASARFAQAYSLREQTATPTSNAVAAQAIQADAQRLVIALNRSGRSEEACQRLQQAQEQHDVAAPDQQTLDQCQRMRVRLRPQVQLSPAIRRATIQPGPAPAPSP
ncbi:MAG: toll/interleukin-1 receptor domain-containing protein [Proteobacteria bacterium]|nr:toll/interleukin-1 receptor domain-containing protein [Pseudomonadota bacterium]